MQLAFREIDLERDYEACFNARKDAYFCSFDTLDGFDEFVSGYRDRIRQRLGNPNWFYIHVWEKNQIIGQLEFRSYSQESETGYVHLIYLIPACRGTGIAGKLQSYIQNELITAGCKRAILSVSRTNYRALKHYERFGWKYLKPNPKHESTDFYQLQLRK